MQQYKALHCKKKVNNQLLRIHRSLVRDVFQPQSRGVLNASQSLNSLHCVPHAKPRHFGRHATRCVTTNKTHAKTTANPLQQLHHKKKHMKRTYFNYRCITFLVQNLFRIVSSFCLHHRHSTFVFGAQVMFTSFSYHHLSTTAPIPVRRRMQSSQT